MREIKFRGIKVSNGEWEYGFYWASLDPCSVETKWRGHYIHNGCNIETPFEIIPETLGECTGSKDKNGVDYYEDDLVQCGDFIGQIYYEPKGCKYMWKHIKSDTYFDATFHDAGYRSEIIGNIHQEYKHLLK